MNSFPPLTTQQFLEVVRYTPLVSIDLVVDDGEGRYLVGLRTNPPAKGYWFVPGGRIRKNEPLDTAFGRICQAELARLVEMKEAALLGLYDHFYGEDFTGGDAGTHYVVLAHRLTVPRAALQLPEDQHSAYRWITAEEALADTSVHPNTQAYFR